MPAQQAAHVCSPDQLGMHADSKKRNHRLAYISAWPSPKDWQRVLYAALSTYASAQQHAVIPPVIDSYPTAPPTAPGAWRMHQRVRQDGTPQSTASWSTALSGLDGPSDNTTRLSLFSWTASAGVTKHRHSHTPSFTYWPLDVRPSSVNSSNTI